MNRRDMLSAVGVALAGAGAKDAEAKAVTVGPEPVLLVVTVPARWFHDKETRRTIRADLQDGLREAGCPVPPIALVPPDMDIKAVPLTGAAGVDVED